MLKNFYSSIVVYLIFFITLFSLQLYFFAHEHTQCNLILVTYVFILFNQCRIMILTMLAIMLDALTHLNTHVTGICILWIVTISWFSLQIKDDMYNKIFIPCMFIFLYAIFYNVSIAYYISTENSASIIFNIFKSTFQNCACLIVIWKLAQKPFHN